MFTGAGESRDVRVLKVGTEKDGYKFLGML
jgi:hypothetical protein